MVIIVMGVSGVGKTTIGKLLAEKLDFIYAEGDAYHPPENVAKMSAGTPLDDNDRQPWLERMAADIDRWLSNSQNAVLACSALKRRYRDILIGSRRNVRLIYLQGDKDTINNRMQQRKDHYMPPSLLDSQFAALEPPQADENPLVIEVNGAPAQIVEILCKDLNIHQ